MKFIILILALATAVVASRCPRYKLLVLTKTSHDAAGLTDTVTKFQDLLGGENNVDLPGPLRKGFRQINWDAAGVPFDMPGNFFDVNVTRGALFQTRTGEFRVSNPVPPPHDDRFDSIIGRKLARMFVRFSLERLFAPLNSNKMTMTFRIPQSRDRATVTGFGAVFTDVDKRKTTSLTFFDRKGCRIAKLFVPPKDKGLSFAGLIVLNRRKKRVAVIAKVKFVYGDVALGKVAKLLRFAKHKFRKVFLDVVVADDFIYGEPQKH